MMQKSSRAQRMERHHARRRVGALNLVSLMDIFTILVFFLLVNSSEVEVLPSAKAIEIPESIAETRPRETVVVMVTNDDVLVQGAKVASLDEVLASPGDVFAPLAEALASQSARVIRKAEESDAVTEVTIMGDKGTPYKVLKTVMRTATGADYDRISLAVLQKDTVGEAMP